MISPRSSSKSKKNEVTTTIHRRHFFNNNNNHHKRKKKSCPENVRQINIPLKRSILFMVLLIVLVIILILQIIFALAASGITKNNTVDDGRMKKIESTILLDMPEENVIISTTTTTSTTTTNMNVKKSIIDSKNDQISIQITSQQQQQQQQDRPPAPAISSSPLSYAIGLIRDLSNIKPSVLNSLIELNCDYDINLHIVSGTEYNITQQKYINDIRSKYIKSKQKTKTKKKKKKKKQQQEQQKCASITVITENPIDVYGIGKKIPHKRVDRIAALRDYQRRLLLLSNFTNNNNNTDGSSSSQIHNNNNGVIIVVDLDLYELPSMETMVSVIKSLSLPKKVVVAEESSSINNNNNNNYNYYPYDVICAAGTSNFKGVKKGQWYYDTYATIFLPDTYSHPLQRRLIKSYYKEENPNLVRSDNKKGNFTQKDIMKYFIKKGKENLKFGVVPVKSCFGGMAIYRTNIFFHNNCYYNMEYNTTHLLRYAIKDGKRPCEHVVFHDCLLGNSNSSSNGKVDDDDVTKIAVHPDLVTYWKKDKKKSK